MILTRFRTINMNTQTHIMKEYPAELTLVFFYTSCVSILAAIAGFFVEPDSSKWRITPSVALASVLCSVKCVLNAHAQPVDNGNRTRPYKYRIWRLWCNNAQGIFGCCINNAIHTWALHLRGPVYVAMFKPLSIAIAAAMGVIILGDTLYLGR